MSELMKCKLNAIKEIAKFILQKKLTNGNQLDSATAKLDQLMKSLLPEEKKQSSTLQDTVITKNKIESKKPLPLSTNEIKKSENFNKF
jgi:uncharacterized membrane protein